MLKNKLSIFLFIGIGFITIANLFWHIYLYRNDVLQRFDGNYWTRRYQQSQWAVPNSKNPIGDDGLYIYEGYRLIKGDDPSLLNPEVPPIGKYFIGFFEITTGYTGVFSVFFSFLFLVVFFFFNKNVFKSNLLAIIPVALFSFEPLFLEQIRAPFLDTLYMSCLLISFLIIFNKKYLLAGIFLGLFMAIKSPFLIFVVYGALIVWLILQKQFSIKHMLSMIVATSFVYTLSYAVLFLHGRTIITFLQVQKYIFHFYAVGAKAVIGAVIPMIAMGKWYNWFGPVEIVSEWTLLWPIVSIGSLLAGYIIIKKKNISIQFQLIWVAIYFLFLLFTPLFPRYLLLLLPFLYNLSVWSIYAATS